MAERLRRIVALSVVTVLAAVVGWLLGGAGRAAAEGQEPSGFVIHADKVVGTIDLGGIILKAPVVLTGDMPIAFIQAKIYGMTLTKQQTMAGHTVSFTFHTDQVARTKWMKMRVKKMEIGGLCMDGVPLVEQCLKDVTVVATELTADELVIPQLSAAAAFGTASVDEGSSMKSNGGQPPETSTETDQPAAPSSGEKPTAPSEPSASPDEPSSATPSGPTNGSSNGAGDGNDPPSVKPAPEKEETPSIPTAPAEQPSTITLPSLDPAGGLIEEVKEEQKKTSELIDQISDVVQSGVSGKTLDGIEQMIRNQTEQLTEQLAQIDAIWQQTNEQLKDMQQELKEHKPPDGTGSGQRLPTQELPAPLSDAGEEKGMIEQVSERIQQYKAQLEQLEEVKQQLEQQKNELKRWLRALP
ncbi:hypothetical protein [Geobacillus kaustophilus]|uniref:hypothetical protein n=1 Tax=Geobacillus kaustophilus TaxID=1462 RepID=UPI0027DB782C|nr:hypothetical protein [Geobacillus kaustophilus]WMJ19386.1 hypothetical protein RA957_14350 [Geobacillus kaustophilus]